MQQPPRPAKPKAKKFLDVRLFIAALSIAVTIGFWNLFSGQAMLAAETEADPNTALPPEPQAEDTSASLVESGPAIPTIAPLVSVTIPEVPSGGAQSENQRSQPISAPAGAPAPALREVAAPTVVVVQKFKPVINVPDAQAQVSSGGGRSTRPVTRTRSSR